MAHPTEEGSRSDSEKDTSSSDTTLAFDRFGRGEPMVLLHGQGFSRRSWDPVVDALTDDHDVIAVDLPGHGDSPR